MRLFISALAVLSAVAPIELYSQTSLEIRVKAADLGSGKNTGCTAIRRSLAAGTPDTVRLSVVKDFKANAEEESPTDVRVEVFGLRSKDVPQGAKFDTLVVASGALTGRTISIRRFDSARSLCLEAGNVAQNPFAKTARRTTSFIAEGAVGTAVQGTTQGGSATGSLGIDHRDIKGPDEQRKLLPILGLGRMKGERLLALITIASTVDTLTDASRATFKGALLAPKLSSRGTLGSGTVDYHPYGEMFAGSSGPRLNFTFARVTWSLNNRDSTVKGVTRDTIFTDNLTIGSFDVRWRWTFIERQQDPDGNDFAFALELGATSRWLAGDGASDKAFLKATTGVDDNFFAGPAAALLIRLRNVTAFADLPYLLKRGSLKGIKGLQPILTISVEAPFFVFSDSP